MNNHEEYEGEVEAELWIRSFAPVGSTERQEAAVERLRELTADGRLADLTVRLWGKAMRRSSPAAYTAAGSVVFERFDEFRAWATTTGRSLEPFFEERTDHSEYTSASGTTIVLPAVALAEYRDGDLVHLAPHTDGDTRVTVEDRIAELASGEPADPDHQQVAAE